MNPKDLLQCGDERRKARDYQAAVPYYARALELAPANRRAHLSLADAYRGLGETGKVIEILEHYLVTSPVDAEAHCRLADAHKKSRHRELAVAHYRRALALEPRNRFALMGLGDLHHKADEPAEALACWEPLLELNPAQVNVQTLVGNIHRKAQAFDRAAACYRLALAHDPGNTFAIFGLADSLRGLGRFEEARPFWEELLRRDPSQQVLTRAGDCFLRLGLLDRAQEMFERSLVSGFDKATLMGLAKVQRLGGEYDVAHQIYRQILERHPGDPRTLALQAETVAEQTAAS
ncbi:lipopolysaccharide assembly protein LapB [Geothrix sp. 21YS21S-2]|uniref:tetratricopeptide repeat protein n=1 Tax=Geothrix sp. 21YS21S-2 TaxID=3068893 RepID=UPI0027BA896A|nr:tetratricopeptide repeat protein [Geothrix sp. 21YS21S-2]